MQNFSVCLIFLFCTVSCVLFVFYCLVYRCMHFMFLYIPYEQINKMQQILQKYILYDRICGCRAMKSNIILIFWVFYEMRKKNMIYIHSKLFLEDYISRAERHIPLLITLCSSMCMYQWTRDLGVILKQKLKSL